MNEWKIERAVFTKKMREEAAKVSDSWKESYQEDKKKVGKPQIKYEFEVWRERLGVRQSDGSILYESRNARYGKKFYQLVLIVTFPLTYLPFKASDVHTYRWNEKHQEFEHESTAIL